MTPSVADCKLYLGNNGAEVDGAYYAEFAAQTRACRRPISRPVTVSTVTGSNLLTLAVAGLFDATDRRAEIAGDDIPAGATILSADIGSATVEISEAATATATVVASVSWPADLVEALYRRVAHNLALRGLPLGVQASFATSSVATNRVGGTDAEVRRLEAPYRRVSIG